MGKQELLGWVLQRLKRDQLGIEVEPKTSKWAPLRQLHRRLQHKKGQLPSQMSPRKTGHKATNLRRPKYIEQKSKARLKALKLPTLYCLLHVFSNRSKRHRTERIGKRQLWQHLEFHSITHSPLFPCGSMCNKKLVSGEEIVKWKFASDCCWLLSLTLPFYGAFSENSRIAGLSVATLK